MAMISRMKLLRTSLQATRTKWMWWPGKESAEDAGLSNSSLFDDKNRLMHIDPGRFVLFNGRWYFPPVTVRPTFELWDHSNLSLVEPKGSSVFSSLFSQRNLYVAAGVVSLGGLGGIGYYAVKHYKKRSDYYKKRSMFAASIGRDFAPIGLAAVPFLAHPLEPANLTTKQKIKEFLRTRNVHAQGLSLEEFLSCLDLKDYLVNLQGKVLEDLATLSCEDLAELGIRLDHRVQMKNGINYLMDLHNKTFDFAPVPNAA